MEKSRENSFRMSVTVFGAGAVGGQIAVRLARAGTPVNVIARGAHLHAIRANGLILQAGEESIRCPIFATDDPTVLGSQALVIVSVKAHELAAAADGIRALIGQESRVLYVMNGLPWWFLDGMAVNLMPDLRHRLDPDGRAANLAPLERVIWGVVRSGGTIVRPGVIRNTTPKTNSLVIGMPLRDQAESVRTTVAMMTRAGYQTKASDNIRADIWAKLLLNASTAIISTIVERNNLDTVSDSETRGIAIACMHEILKIGRTIGIDIDADPIALTEPARTSAHCSSLLQDIRAGRPVELAHTILAVRDIARSVGIKAPHLTTLAALIAMRAKGGGKA